MPMFNTYFFTIRKISVKFSQSNHSPPQCIKGWCCLWMLKTSYAITNLHSKTIYQGKINPKGLQTVSNCDVVFIFYYYYMEQKPIPTFCLAWPVRICCLPIHAFRVICGQFWFIKWFHSSVSFNILSNVWIEENCKNTISSH